MEPLISFALLFAGVTLFVYQFSTRQFVGEVHLPQEIKGQGRAKEFDFKEILAVPASVAGRLIETGNIPLENLKKKLISAGKPLTANQFFALKFLLMAALPCFTFIIFQPKPILYTLPLLLGFVIPDLWLNHRVNKRQGAILRELPHIIDVLNICVEGGLDFMVAVNRVIEEFRPCALIAEFKVLTQEIEMGSSRRDALKNLANRINSPEVTSFTRTLLQADRMGTPIGEVLRMQAEELRIRRFQKGEEMALKAPIKLLFPLLFFILPVVLIIVAGPILIQFTRGGFIKF